MHQPTPQNAIDRGPLKGLLPVLDGSEVYAKVKAQPFSKGKTQIALEEIHFEKAIAETAAPPPAVHPSQVTARNAQVLENLETLFGAQGLAGDS